MKEKSEKWICEWEEKRKSGKWNYIFRTASYQTLLTIFILSFMEWFFGSSFVEGLNFPIFVIILFIGSLMLFGGLVNWWEKDAKYKNYLLDQKIEKGL